MDFSLDNFHFLQKLCQIMCSSICDTTLPWTEQNFYNELFLEEGKRVASKLISTRKKTKQNYYTILGVSSVERKHLNLKTIN